MKIGLETRKESGKMGIINDIESKLEEVKQEMCDRYCKWPAEYGDRDDDLWKEKCDHCPLSKL